MDRLSFSVVCIYINIQTRACRNHILFTGRKGKAASTQTGN